MSWATLNCDLTALPIPAVDKDKETRLLLAKVNLQVHVFKVHN